MGIAAKEASAVDRALVAFRDKLFNARVDVFVANKAVVEAWNNQRSRGLKLNMALKRRFIATSKLNLSLLMSYIQTGQNSADALTLIVNFRMACGRLFRGSLVAGRATLVTLWLWIQTL